MLIHLGVSNFGVLRDAAIEPDPGFTVITGETGTGKTLLLGGLRLLMGQKPPTNLIGPFGDETTAQGLFEIDGEEVGLTRVVPASGRSRAYRDGNVTSAGSLEEVTSDWVEIAGQHDHVQLRRPSTVLSLVDELVSQGRPGLAGSYREAWEAHGRLLRDRDELGGDTTTLERELDLATYQIDEIKAAGLGDHDEDSVEALSARLRNHDTIKDGIARVLGELELMATPGGEVASALRRLAVLDPEMAGLSADADAVDLQIGSIRRGIETYWETLDQLQGDMADLEPWLTRLGDLKRKYGRTLDEVRAHAREQEGRVIGIKAALSRSATIDAEVEASWSRLAALAAELSAARKVAGDALVEEGMGHLGDLALGSAVLSLDWSQVEPGASGADQVRLLFASDARLAAAPIGEVASGGELSRLVLSLRLAMRTASGSTLVFDEVDAGIGGATALALGEKIARLGEKGQVIAVTHLPQVAARATRHYVVERTGETATVRLVDGEERITELTRMLSGLPGSESGRETVSELLAAAGAVAHPG